ncbi:hypothetical protein M422DRAFT_253069 [Sphaerobolus stellatus SS14]|uniref:Uncharacterized protein n=1 Tax=Sphaerobolus stellatus (strain SS14) TaxID=990650 RepID=A0A0C9V953_SPHS4|nr:hypothetical protein M422DRAFT_253069 [Sphaerobolus stellatus SS14]
MVTKLNTEIASKDGSQFRPRLIEAPSRVAILKKIREEETPATFRSGIKQSTHSACLTASVGINMGLDLEMHQQNLRQKLQLRKSPTDQQELDLDDSRRDFMPPDALQEPLTMEPAPEKAKLSLPLDFN